LSYAAVATVGDVSPVIGDNRIIVKNGLREEALNHLVGSGLTALKTASYIRTPSITQGDVAFQIAPKINAVGRIDDPRIAYQILIEQDPSMAESMAQVLLDFNAKRKDRQKEIEKQASKTVRKNPDAYKYGIAVYNPAWEVGIAGIAASKLTEEFNRPALVLGSINNVVKGSGRSVKSIHLKEILDSCSDLFERYGGHKYAAGVTVKPSVINEIADRFNKACKEWYDANQYPNDDKFYDAELYPKTVTLETAEMLRSSLYPYCPESNPEPVFLLSDVIISETENKSKKEYINVLHFYAVKGSFQIPVKLQMFSTDHGTEINGLTADLYFSFPQVLDANEPEKNLLQVHDIIFKK
jgi:single-stranded-DNA-specific exonuclease